MERERGRGNGGKERRTEEGTGELLVMAGERDDDHDSKTKVGTSFVRGSSSREREGGKGCLYLNWGLLGLIGRNDRSVLRLPTSSLSRSLGN